MPSTRRNYPPVFSPFRMGRPANAGLFLLLSVSVLFSAGLQADVVTLKNGRVLEGEVSEDGEQYIVNLAFGSVRISKKDVDSIQKKITPLDEFRAKSETLQKSAKEGALKGTELAQAWFELARWCENAQLPRSREEALRKAVEADPDHGGARTALGFVKMGNDWVTPAQKMQAMGLVLYKDRWVEPQARAEAERAAHQASDVDRARALDIAQRETELKIREAELEKKRLETELLRGQLTQQNTPPQQSPRYISVGDPFWIPGYGWDNQPVMVRSTPPSAPATTPTTPPASSDVKTGPKDNTYPFTSPTHTGNTGPGFPFLK